MKKIIILSLIILTLLFSGCLEQELLGETKVLLEDGETYNEGDPLLGLTFLIPEEIDVTNGIYISLDIILPDESSEGIYTQSFYPVENLELFVDTYAVTLYYPGTWEIIYSIYQGTHEESPLILSGEGRFHVESNDHTLESFEIIEWECPENVGYVESFYVNFTIKNVGMEPGSVHMSLFNKELTETLAIYEIGHEWWSNEKYLQDDETFSHSERIPVPENDLTVTLRFNDQEFSQVVDVAGSEEHPSVDNIPMDLLLLILIIVVMIVIFLIIRR